MSAERPRCQHAAGRSKVTYRSAAKARRAARLLRGGDREGMAGLRWSAYRCPQCPGWHLTTAADR